MFKFNEQFEENFSKKSKNQIPDHLLPKVV